ncbi:MAG: hypothetical protein ACM3W4_09075 [Ignavibacteriales bacterium]
MAITTSRTMAAVVGLVVHVLVGVLLFSIITIAAVFLNWVTALCETHHMAPTWLITGMQGIEMFLWAADVVCFGLLILVEVWKFCVTVWRNREIET